MKKIFVIFIAVGILRGLSGIEINAGNNADQYSADLRSAHNEEGPVPTYTYLDGNLFLAIDSKKDLHLSEGAIIEFNFGKRKIVKSFHVNDINQDIIDKGDADLFVMIHHDLALSLKNEKLIKIKVIDEGTIYRISVDKQWQPHKLIAQI